MLTFTIKIQKYVIVCVIYLEFKEFFPFFSSKENTQFFIITILGINLEFDIHLCLIWILF